MVIIRKKHKESSEEKELRQKKEQEQARGIQDSYQARGFELVWWIQEHKRLVSAFIVALVVAGGLLSAFLYYQKRSREIASSAYLEAVKITEDTPKDSEENKGRWKTAETELETLGKSRNSGIAALANLYAGHLAMDDKDKKNAKELYHAAISRLSTSDILYPLSMTGYGYAQEREGDLKGALATFETLIDMKNNPSKDLALFESARLANQLKETERAKKNAARLLEEYPSSVYESSAQRFK